MLVLAARAFSRSGFRAGMAFKLPRATGALELGRVSSDRTHCGGVLAIVIIIIIATVTVIIIVIIIIVIVIILIILIIVITVFCTTMGAVTMSFPGIVMISVAAQYHLVLQG